MRKPEFFLSRGGAEGPRVRHRGRHKMKIVPDICYADRGYSQTNCPNAKTQIVYTGAEPRAPECAIGLTWLQKTINCPGKLKFGIWAKPGTQLFQ